MSQASRLFSPSTPVLNWVLILIIIIVFFYFTFFSWFFSFLPWDLFFYFSTYLSTIKMVTSDFSSIQLSLIVAPISSRSCFLKFSFKLRHLGALAYERMHQESCYHRKWFSHSWPSVYLNSAN